MTMTLSALGPILAAGIGFFVVNDVLTVGAVALAEGVPVVPYRLEDLRFQVAIASALLSLAPIVLISADDSIWFVPLLAVPVAAVYWGASASLQNTVLIARLEESLAHLTELNRLKDDFVAVGSHELRTPLTSIQGYVKTLLQLDELEDADRRSFLEAADRQGDRLRRLIEQLLVTSRLETHEEPLSVAPVSIPLLVRQVVEEVRATAHGHTFDVRVDPSLHAIESDEAKIHQIVSNLVENALKYSPPDTRVTIRAHGVDEGIAISVADEGPGIAVDAREHVFERFYQADSSTTRKVGGTGLGLYICRKMTESLGGRLTLDRTGHDGSVFTLWVPLELAGSVADGVPEADAAGGRLIDLRRRRGLRSLACARSLLEPPGTPSSDDDEGLSGLHHLTLLDRQVGDDTFPRSRDRVLHLHGLEDAHHVAGLDPLPRLDEDPQDRALHRGRDHAVDVLTVMGRPADRGARRCVPAVVEDPHLDAPAFELDEELGRSRCAGFGDLDRRLALGELGVAQGALEPGRGVGAGAEGLRLQDPAVERDRGRDALDPELLEGPEHAAAGGLAVLASDDQLGEHRVVVRGDVLPRPDRRVDAHERTRGLLIVAHPTGRGEEVPGGVLGVDPALDRVAGGSHVGQVDTLPEGHPDLERDEVEAGDLLGHRVLDLEPGVHLEEGEAAVLVDDALHGSRVDVARLLGERHRRLADPGPELRVDDGRGGLLDQLLMSTLHRAVPLAQEGHGAVRVGQDLGLDVVRSVEVALEEDLGAAEVRLGLPRRALQRGVELLGSAHDVHALPAPSERRLHQERVTDPLGLGGGVVRGDRLMGARDDRDAHPVGRLPGDGLVAHHLDRVGRRPDEGQSGVLDRSSEVRPLRDEPVAGMDHRGPGAPGRVEDRADRQVRVGREPRADPVGLVGHLDVEGVTVGVRVHGHGAEAQLANRPDDPNGDLPPVRDQDACRRHMRSGWR